MSFYSILKYKIICLLFLSSGLAYSQLSGRVIDFKTDEPIPYVNYYNLRTQQGGLSDESGNFLITNFLPADTFEFSIIGYKILRMKAADIRSIAAIRLSENPQLLSEVPVLAYDERWHKLLLEAKSNFRQDPYCSKSYYLLESYRDSQQVELLESFFNVTIQGAEMGNLQMKSGRFGLNPKDGQVFLSQDISAAIIQMKTTEQQKSMPVSPLQLNRKALKKAYYIRPVQEYIDDKGNNIIVLEAEPNGKQLTHFAGKIWIDTKYNTILKTVWNIEKTKRHPFLPIFPDDTLKYVNLTVTKTFESTGNVSACIRTDFQYEILYQQAGATEPFFIKTQAILDAYDDSGKFELPAFNLPYDLNDYRKIQALPPQDYFWKNHNEMHIENKRESNDAFLSKIATFNRSNLFTQQVFGQEKTGFRWLYCQWSPQTRIFAKDINRPGDEFFVKAGAPKVDMYNLHVQFYLDIYHFTDTIVLSSAVILDPYASFYHMPMDSLTYCFINVYFDLMEIKRREFISRCESSNWDKSEIWEQYRAEKISFHCYQSDLLKELQRGNNLESLTNYNDYIKEKLGIDNMAIFGIKRL
jgi:hypothetical protein